MSKNIIEQMSDKMARELSEKEDQALKEKLENIFIGIKIKKTTLSGKDKIIIKFKVKKTWE